MKQDWIEERERHPVLLRRRALGELIQSPARTALLYDILVHLGASSDFDKDLRASFQILAKAVPLNKAGVFTWRENKCVLLSGYGLPEHCFSRLTLPVDDGILAQMAA